MLPVLAMVRLGGLEDPGTVEVPVRVVVERPVTVGTQGAGEIVPHGLETDPVGFGQGTAAPAEDLGEELEVMNRHPVIMGRHLGLDAVGIDLLSELGGQYPPRRSPARPGRS